MRRVGDLKGPGSKVSEVLTELFPMVDVERVPGELLALGGTVIGHGGTLLTGAAGEAPGIQLFNPDASGKLVTLTRCMFSSSVSGVLRFAVTGIALSGGPGVESPRDSRLGLTSQTSALVRTQSAVALLDATFQLRAIADVTQTLEPRNTLAVLGPGDAFHCGGSDFAATITVAFWWRERVAEPSELRL